MKLKTKSCFIRYNSIDLARHIIYELENKNIKNISSIKIQNLLYIVYGLYLACYEKKILIEQPKYFLCGLFFPEVLKKFDELTSLKLDLSDDLKKIIEFTMKCFGNISDGKLYAWLHEKNSPWDKIKKNKKIDEYINDGYLLSDIEIMNFFREFLKNK